MTKQPCISSGNDEKGSIRRRAPRPCRCNHWVPVSIHCLVSKRGENKSCSRQLDERERKKEEKKSISYRPNRKDNIFMYRKVGFIF